MEIFLSYHDCEILIFAECKTSFGRRKQKFVCANNCLSNDNGKEAVR